MRILIADDNLDLAEAIASVLRPRGVDAVVVGDGDAAIRVAARNTFDAALVDLLLPGRSGVDVLSVLRKESTAWPLLAMTGFDRPHDREALRQLGIDEVLKKPFAVPELLGKLGLDRVQLGFPTRCRVAVLIEDRAELPHRPTGCIVDRFEEPDLLREAVADHAYDAAVILTQSPDHDLFEDLKVLDRDLAVLGTCEPHLLAAATERTSHRREATRSLALLESAFDRFETPMVIVSGDPPVIERWNRELLALLGHRPEELQGVPVTVLEDPDAIAGTGLGALVAEVLAGVDEVRRRVPVRIRGGTSRIMPARAHRLHDAEPAVAVSLEPGDHQQGHKEALQLLGATAAGVAHEMRNTLAGIGSSLSVLLSRMDSTTSEGQVLSRIGERISRASEVMSDLLAYARPTTPRLKVVPLRMILEAAAEQVRAQAAGGPVVQVVQEDPTLRVRVDPVALQLALVNLGLNAIQALGPRGTVTVSGRLLGDSVLLRVDDDGPGVPSELRGKIFRPFFTTRARGSGLGLANVRKVAEAHGGAVELLPLEPGAHFVIRLPVNPEAPGVEE